jgi:hypothetical protein
MQNLNSLLKRLLESNLDFVIVGGFAGVVHGATQVTQDLDVCLVIDEDKIQLLRQCLSDIDPRHRMRPQKESFLDIPDSIDNLKNIYLETDLGVVDLMSEIPGLGDFQRVKKGALEIQLFGLPCWVMGLDDLIKVKKNLSRAKDMALYQELLEIKKKMES